MTIEWDEAQPTIRMRLMKVRPSHLDSCTRCGHVQIAATLDDLRKACDAVGLVVVDAVAPPKALRLPVRTAARNRQGLDGADAQALEGALSMTERERDEAKGEAATLRAQLVEAEAELKRVPFSYEPAWRLCAAKAAETRDILDLALSTGLSLCETYRNAAQFAIERLGQHNARARDAGFTFDAIAPILDAYAAQEVSTSRAVEMLREIAPVPTPTEGQASDEELFVIGRKAYNNAAGLAERPSDAAGIAAARAVAARVRRERGECLVERLVAKGIDFEVYEQRRGGWTVEAQPTAPEKNTMEDIPAAEVPATLARLAGVESK